MLRYESNFSIQLRLLFERMWNISVDILPLLNCVSIFALFLMGNTMYKGVVMMNASRVDETESLG